jgi:hypothetical protein
MRLSLGSALFLSLFIAVPGAHAKEKAPKAPKPPKWQVMENYYSAGAVEYKNLALVSVNVDMGVHLEKLTLISGEGHTDKKAMGIAMAAVSQKLGVAGDYAQREPVEDHFPTDDATRIAQDVVQMLEAGLKPADGTLIGTAAVAALPGYAALKGETEIDTAKEEVEGGMFKSDSFFGVLKVPAAPLKYRKPPMMYMSDKELAPMVRSGLKSDAAIEVEFGVRNTREEIYLSKMVFRVFVPGAKKPEVHPIALTLTLDGADRVRAPVTGSHKEAYRHWEALRPLVAPLVQQAAQQIQTSLATHKGRRG